MIYDTIVNIHKNATIHYIYKIKLKQNLKSNDNNTINSNNRKAGSVKEKAQYFSSMMRKYNFIKYN